MALDLAGLGIRVNANRLARRWPGLRAPANADPEARRATKAAIPLGRLGQPDDLVGASARCCFSPPTSRAG